MTQQAAGTLTLEQRVKAPLEIVFSYFTDPQRHSVWTGGDAELDPRPGGIYRLRLAPDFEIRGEYVVVEPPRRVVYTWGLETTRALPEGVEAVPAGSTTVEITLATDGDDTVLRLRHSGFPGDEYVPPYERGWKYVLERMQVYAAGGDPGPFDASAI